MFVEKNSRESTESAPLRQKVLVQELQAKRLWSQTPSELNTDEEV